MYKSNISSSQRTEEAIFIFLSLNCTKWTKLKFSITINSEATIVSYDYGFVTNSNKNLNPTSGKDSTAIGHHSIQISTLVTP